MLPPQICATPPYLDQHLESSAPMNDAILFIYTVEIGLFFRRFFLPPCMSLFLNNTIYIRKHIVFFCYLYHAKMYNLNVFSIGLFPPLNFILYNVGSEAKLPVFWTEKANYLSFR